MRRKRSLIFAVLTSFIFALTPKKAFATVESQEDSAWEKLETSPSMVTSVETTPYGLLLGENDSRLWNEPFNGLYQSRDLGLSWNIHALGERGVTDIAYYKGSTYATTYYNVEDTLGLFVNEGDETWTHIGPDFSASAVDRNGSVVFLGGFSHGLWVSRDMGQSWKQKLGHGWYGPEIYDIQSAGGITLANTAWGFKKSTDYGSSWEALDFFTGKTVTSMFLSKDFWLVGTTTGLYLSQDSGSNWIEVSYFSSFKVTALTNYLGITYVGVKTDSVNTIFYSQDLETWHDTNLDSNLTNETIDLAVAISEPSYIYAMAQNDGLYRHTLTKPNQEITPFLQIPWDYSSSNELMDRLTAYFDHQYPVLGYLEEPAGTETTTLNFLGDQEAPPKMYYSSHSGSDFYLDYGTPIWAAAAGYANYYYCTDCGHTIKINHGNGVQTIYMHLQTEGLVTGNGPETPVWVETGQNIGKVGLTGNTTGAHLHFEVVKDKNDNGSFDDFPFGRIDPFGWQSKTVLDPWKTSIWQTATGEQTGTNSDYLWQVTLPYLAELTSSEGGIYSLNNKTVELQPDSIDENSTLFIRNGPGGATSAAQDYLTYVENTSLMVNLLDIMGNPITEPTNPVTIGFYIERTQIKKFVQNSLQIYAWNNTTGLWDPLTTTQEWKDSGELYLYALTPHLSRFAVFGEKREVFVDTGKIGGTRFEVGTWPTL